MGVGIAEPKQLCIVTAAAADTSSNFECGLGIGG